MSFKPYPFIPEENKRYGKRGERQNTNNSITVVARLEA